MARATVIIQSQFDREKIARWARAVPYGTRVEFKEVKRSLPQNDRMWAMLTDIAQQVTHHGVKLSTEDWKLVFLEALKREMRIVPNLDGTGFVNLGRSSSDLSKAEMTDLIELMFAFGTQRGVVFHDQKEQAA